MLKLSLAIILLAGPLAAQDTPTDQNWAQKTGDTLLTDAALQQRLTGQTITFYDDGQSYYYPDGRYTYTYADEGGVAYGHYQLEPDSTVCVAFVNGFSRCDRFVQTAERLVMLTAKGDRFPVRPRP
jgi:hypothetical protein